jgi:hypothetical protein
MQDPRLNRASGESLLQYRLRREGVVISYVFLFITYVIASRRRHLHPVFEFELLSNSWQFMAIRAFGAVQVSNLHLIGENLSIRWRLFLENRNDMALNYFLFLPLSERVLRAFLFTSSLKKLRAASSGG